MKQPTQEDYDDVMEGEEYIFEDAQPIDICAECMHIDKCQLRTPYKGRCRTYDLINGGKR